MTEIKICGIKTLEDVNIINRYDIQYAGFIFSKRSKRCINSEIAKKLILNLREDIKAVGVFTDTDVDEIYKIASECNLNICQLHSDETLNDCKKLKKHMSVWKSISVKSFISTDYIQNYADCVDRILLDTYKEGVLGGSGETFNWDLANNLSSKYSVVLAGGLNESNILKAIEKVKPQAVDICSGVETDSKKDEVKIKNIVRRIRNGIE